MLQDCLFSFCCETSKLKIEQRSKKNNGPCALQHLLFNNLFYVVFETSLNIFQYVVQTIMLFVGFFTNNHVFAMFL